MTKENMPDQLKDDDDSFYEDQPEFMPCDKCDGHPACEDFGCAFELGLGRMVKRDIPEGLDNW